MCLIWQSPGRQRNTGGTRPVCAWTARRRSTWCPLPPWWQTAAVCCWRRRWSAPSLHEAGYPATVTCCVCQTAAPTASSCHTQKSGQSTMTAETGNTADNHADTSSGWLWPAIIKIQCLVCRAWSINKFSIPLPSFHYNMDVPLVEFIYLVFTCMPGESYHRQLRSLLLCLCDIFRGALSLHLSPPDPLTLHLSTPYPSSLHLCRPYPSSLHLSPPDPSSLHLSPLDPSSLSPPDPSTSPHHIPHPSTSHHHIPHPSTSPHHIPHPSTSHQIPSLTTRSLIPPPLPTRSLIPPHQILHPSTSPPDPSSLHTRSCIPPPHHQIPHPSTPDPASLHLTTRSLIPPPLPTRSLIPPPHHQIPHPSTSHLISGPEQIEENVKLEVGLFLQLLLVLPVAEHHTGQGDGHLHLHFLTGGVQQDLHQDGDAPLIRNASLGHLVVAVCHTCSSSFTEWDRCLMLFPLYESECEEKPQKDTLLSVQCCFCCCCFLWQGC